VDHGYDYYDGLLDITHGSDYVTVSYNYFHDHWKVFELLLSFSGRGLTSRLPEVLFDRW